MISLTRHFLRSSCNSRQKIASLKGQWYNKAPCFNLSQISEEIHHVTDRAFYSRRGSVHGRVRRRSLQRAVYQAFKLAPRRFSRLCFGGFQAAMPLIGFLCGSHFKDAIASFDHWIAFLLLAAIGFSMIREACSKEEDELDSSLGFKTMSILALATSIDALAVGVTLSFLSVEIVPAVSFIGIITFLFSAAGVKAGHVFGTR